jgi:hydroxymethylpyrimidine/phosphomethylpyrimidine kinase
MAVSDIKTMEEAARRIADLGPRAVLVKGGHLEREAVDLLYRDDEVHLFTSTRIETPHTHGTGCTYSAAITAELAKGHTLRDAIAVAKKFVTLAIQSSPGLGKGFGPLNHQVVI